MWSHMMSIVPSAASLQLAGFLGTPSRTEQERVIRARMAPVRWYVVFCQKKQYLACCRETPGRLGGAANFI